jgi:hypothetical protein
MDYIGGKQVGNYKDEAKIKLGLLIEEYKRNTDTISKKNITEETIRGYLNKMLEIFGWDILNTKEIIQEKKLTGIEKIRLVEIHSSHSKPDYKMMKGTNTVSFLDAKDLNVDISKVDFAANKVAFQIRSYGWSAQVPCSFVSNFEQFGIYQTTFKPNQTQLSSYGTIFLNIDEYLENFDLLYDYLNKGSVYSGKLEELMGVYKDKAHQTLDIDFMKILSEFRLVLGENLLKKNPGLDTEGYFKLNYLIQVIMDRVIFIRVCESRGIEKENLLKDYIKQGFWKTFKNSCYFDFYEHYDGAMFERIDDFNKLTIDNEVMENFIEHLYLPSPYRFDVIPVTLIAEIYEYFLAKKVEVLDGKVIETFKGIYQKSKGAVSTPKYLVDFICTTTLNVESFNSVGEILSITIFEPACGSGTFLLSAYSLLEQRMIELFKEGKVEDSYHNWFVSEDESIYLTIDAKREIMKKCLYGMDIDRTAIEVTKMSLALKVIDNNTPLILKEVGVYGEQILKEIHMNMVHGNTLVENDFLEFKDVSTAEIYEANPVDLASEYEGVFDNGGFDFIIGNPPYVEPKHYTALYPRMYEYIKGKHYLGKGKSDISLYFIKRALSILKNEGKIGFLTQKRFFKTAYGVNIRTQLSENKFLEEVYDFKSNSLFKNKNTYVAFLLLSNKRNDFAKYQLILSENPNEVKDIVENNLLSADNNQVKSIEVPYKVLKEKTWSFDTFNAINFLKDMEERGISTLGSIESLKISTGVQVLSNKLYRFKNCVNLDGKIRGTNRFNEIIEIEEGITKKLVHNNDFCAFKKPVTDTYILFPYRGANYDELMTLQEIKTDYPLAYKYLTENEQRIKEIGKFLPFDMWHGYTRKHNHQHLEEKKIFIPMTSRIPRATFVEKGQSLIPDNANMYQIIFKNSSNLPNELLKAIACIINSSVFSYFAKLLANPQLDGNYKFNKQFLEPVPFPFEKLVDNQAMINNLSRLYDSIQENIESDTCESERVRESVLKQRRKKLNEMVFDLYELSGEEISLINSDFTTVD